MLLAAVCAGICINAVLRAPAQEGDGPAMRRQRQSEAPKRIAVALIDDRVLFGQSLATAMNDQTTDLVAMHWKSVDALAAVPSVLQDADVVLVCIGRSSLSRGSMSRLIKALLKQDGHPPVAILADTADADIVAAGPAMGLRGVLSGKASLEVVASALRQIHAGGTIVP